MISYYQQHFARLANLARWWRFWLHERPLLVGSISVIVVVFLAQWIATAPAYAAAAYDPNGIITDTYGVPATSYTTLPISDGGVMGSPGDKMNHWMLDLAWTVSHQLSLIQLSIFAIILDFQWVDWIATPLTSFVDGLGRLLRDFSFLQVGLGLSAFVGGIYLLRGRFGTGILEMLFAAAAAALLTGVLANPTEWLTGEGGAIHSAGDYGREVASIIATGESGGKYTASNAVLQPLVDLLIRQPYQFVGFGALVTGDCADVLTAAVSSDKFDDSGYVRDQVRGCDSAAGEFADKPGAMMVWNLFVSFAARANIQVPIGIGIVILQITVVFLLVDSFRLLVGLFRAMFPGNRSGAFSAGFGMLSGLLSIVVQLTLLVMFSTAAQQLQAAMSGLLPYAVTQLLAMGLFVAMVVAIVVVIWQLRQRSKMLAARAAQLGYTAAPVRPLPIAETTRSAIGAVQRGVHTVSSLRTASAVSAATDRAPVMQHVSVFNSTTYANEGSRRYPAPEGPTGGSGASASPSAPTPMPGGAGTKDSPIPGRFDRRSSSTASKVATVVDVGTRAARVVAAGAATGGTGALTQGAKELGSIAVERAARRVTVDKSTGAAEISRGASTQLALPPGRSRAPSAASSSIRLQLEAAKGQ